MALTAELQPLITVTEHVILGARQSPFPPRETGILCEIAEFLIEFPKFSMVARKFDLKKPLNPWLGNPGLLLFCKLRLHAAIALEWGELSLREVRVSLISARSAEGQGRV